MKILVIDDHPLIQDALTQLLPQLGDDIDVRSATDAAAATTILDNEPDVALVLLDLALPGTRGLDLLADLMLDYPGVPVVVLSATHDRATVNAALAAGARGFIAKTADARELLDAVRQSIARRRIPDAGHHARARRRRRAHRAGRARPHATSGRRADAARPGQAEQAHLPRPQAVRGHGQGARQRDPQGAQRAHRARRPSPRSRAAASASRRSPPVADDDRRAAAIAAPLLARARADQVATLYRSWHRTTASMALGAAILCHRAVGSRGRGRDGALVRGDPGEPGVARCARARVPARAPPTSPMRRGGAATGRSGSTIAGALWGVAAVVMFPASPPHQALLIVCLFSVILGGLNLTAVYKPSFYGFALAALVPLDRARRASRADQVHLFTALVLLRRARIRAFVRPSAQRPAHALARDPLRKRRPDRASSRAQTRAAESARAAAETANRAKSQFLAAASHDLRQPLHAMGLFSAALSAKARDPEMKPLAASIHASVEALEALFGQLLDLSRLDAGALQPERGDVPLGPLFARLAADFAPQAAARGLALRVVPDARGAWIPIRCCSSASCATFSPTRCATRARAASCSAPAARGAALRIDVVDTGIGIAPVRSRAHLRRVRAGRRPRARHDARPRHGTRARDRPPAVRAARPSARTRVDAGSRLALFRDAAAGRAAPAARRHPPTRELASAIGAAAPRASPDARSSSSTTTRPWSRRCARCSRRGARASPAAATQPRATRASAARHRT